MRVQRLKLRNFRNIQEAELLPDARLNFLVGSNGQGKTSFLEAVAYLGTLRSFRGSKTQEVIRWEAENSEVTCDLVADGDATWKTELKVAFAVSDPSRQRASKVAFINGKAYRSSTSYLSQRFGHFELGFHSVIFNPADHDLVRGDPGTRRSYLDRVIAAEDIDYLKTLSLYQRLLDQRNALLKQEARPSSDVLVGFTSPLVEYGAQLTLKRLQWIQKLSVRLNDTSLQIAPQQPFLRLIYASNWAPPIEGFCIPNESLGPVHLTGLGPLPSLEILEQAFWKKLSALEGAEWRAGHTLTGPHRDDWSFFYGEQALKGHGSQGEVRSALLALKLCEIELFRSATGHRPLFLLDDFSSELDKERREFLLKFLLESDLQVFVSTTDESFGKLAGSKDATILKVSNGSLVHARSTDPERERLLGG